MASNRSAVAVYCGSSTGRHQAFCAAAQSLGAALSAAGRPLVYGGGSAGIMGIVSGSALRGGGKVIGVIPRAMAAGGGEGEIDSNSVQLHSSREKVETIFVDSMHERKIEMAKRADAFIGLPGGFGTFEEVLEVTTWSQIGIHDKPVILLNVLSFWDPLRSLIRTAIAAGFIKPANERLIIFIDGPARADDHESFDWGKAAIEALDGWQEGGNKPLFQWDGIDTSPPYSRT